MATMSKEPHGSRLMRTDLPPTDSEAKVLAELTAAAAAWWSSVVPQSQSRPPTRSNLRGGSWAEITSAAALLSLQPPPAASGSGSSAGESGYNSHLSVATIPADYRPQQRGKSVSVDHTGSTFIPANGGTATLHELAAAERRRLFQRRHTRWAHDNNERISESRRTSFQDEDDFGCHDSDEVFLDCGLDLGEEDGVGEWLIERSELSFHKKINDNGGHAVHAGKWHGDVNIHTFGNSSFDLSEVRRLAMIRHENIVLYMGVSVGVGGGCYSIVTSAVKADSLHYRLTSRKKMPVDYKVLVARQMANALGYIHSRGIVHGRLSSQNVFLENKVQLSLIDYAAGAPNAVYSSPQAIRNSGVSDGSDVILYRGTDPSDDVFSFGTLLFETFAGKIPFLGSENGVAKCSADDVAARVLSNRLPDAIQDLDLTTDRLRTLIRLCWSFEAAERPSFAQLVSEFGPGCRLLRRLSTSEPRLDQIDVKALRRLPTLSGRR